MSKISFFLDWKNWKKRRMLKKYIDAKKETKWDINMARHMAYIKFNNKLDTNDNKYIYFK